MSFFLTTAAASFRRGGGETEPEPEPIVYEAQTTAYMNAIGVPNDSTPTIYGKTGAEVWQLFNSCIMIAKNAGKLDNINTWHPMFGNTNATIGINAMNPDTFFKNFYGSWIFDENGNKPNGSNTYATSGFNPAQQVGFIPDNFAFTIVSNTNLPIGSTEGLNSIGTRGITSGGLFVISIKRLTDVHRVRIGDDEILTSTTDSRGIFTAALSSGQIKQWKTGVLIEAKTATNANSPDDDIYYGAYKNRSASPLGYEKQTLLSEAIHMGDDTTVQVVHQMIDTWEAGLNRKTW